MKSTTTTTGNRQAFFFFAACAAHEGIFLLDRFTPIPIGSSGKSADNCLVLSCRQDKLLKDFLSYVSTPFPSNMRTGFSSSFFLMMELLSLSFARPNTHFICIPNCVCITSLLIFSHFVLLLIMRINTRKNRRTSSSSSSSSAH